MVWIDDEWTVVIWWIWMYRVGWMMRIYEHTKGMKHNEWCKLTMNGRCMNAWIWTQYLRITYLVHTLFTHKWRGLNAGEQVDAYSGGCNFKLKNTTAYLRYFPSRLKVRCGGVVWMIWVVWMICVIQTVYICFWEIFFHYDRRYICIYISVKDMYSLAKSVLWKAGV